MARIADKVQKAAWFIMIALLPITSMPLVGRLLGADSVSSPAILFLLIFAAAWVVSGWNNRLEINRNIFGLILFSLGALIASLISLFYEFPSFKDFNAISPMISGLGTLVIGVLFFASASSYPEESGLRKTAFRIINASGLIVLVWCAFQAVSWYTRNGYPEWMFDFQNLFSQRVLYRQRVTGFALEPSWLAHQLNLLYLPYWLASTLTRTSSHQIRLVGLSVENFLLAGGVLMLGLTLSRVGFAAFFLMLLVAGIFIHSRVVSLIQHWIDRRSSGRRSVRTGVISTIILAFYLLIFVGAILVYTRVDPRMANLFNLNLGGDNPLLRYFNELKFGDRVIYWLTGWNIFNDYPVLGVGLGNAGFFFPKEIPDFGWSLVEVRMLMYRSTLLLNIKNLWLRLLAETGIIGFSVFIGWLISLIPDFIRKFRSETRTVKMLGLMGMMTLAALFFESFSIDSFAMPYWWISLGLAVASYKA